MTDTKLETLIEDYQRRIRSATTIIEDPATSQSQRDRVHGKLESYKSFVRELESLEVSTPSTPVQGYREAQRYRQYLELIKRNELVTHMRKTATWKVADEALSQTDIQPSGWYCARCKETVPSEHVTYSECHDERAGGCGMPVSPGINSTEDQPGPSISSTRLMLSSTEEEETDV